MRGGAVGGEMGRSDKSPISGKEIEKGHVDSTTADKETRFEGKKLWHTMDGNSTAVKPRTQQESSYRKEISQQTGSR
jgi:hypothetical protein